MARPLPGCRGARPLRVLFVASEAYPLAKTGGLADVIAALPRALARENVDVRIMIPAYPEALDGLAEKRVVAQVSWDLAEGRIIGGVAPDSGVPVYLYDAPSLFCRKGSLYQDGEGREWSDNHIRFGSFSRAAAQIARGKTAIGWSPDVVHAHDWHAALVPALLALGQEEPAPRTLFTIHNMAFQGNYPLTVARDLALPDELASANGAEFYGQLSYLKAGLRYSDRLTTVSPTYAKEILTPEFGCGLDGVLRSRADDLVGILNGVDYAIWNPAVDEALPCRYEADDMAGKALCKQAVQDTLGLERGDRPLIAYINRLTHQKMADVVLQALPGLVAGGAQFVLHGQGDKALESAFAETARTFGGQVAVKIGYDEETARRITAAADITLTPSRFEPCGLTTMYGMRYGALPVTRQVGGLADTVIDADNDDGMPATGFLFERETPESLVSCVGRAMNWYRDGDWQSLRRSAMRRDFSWERSAQRYLEVYQDLITPARRHELQAA